MLTTLPRKPGVYIMRDKTGAILYIGKAVNLRKRVANYFRPQGLDVKVRALVSEIRHIDYIIAESEREALIIEHRLVNRHQPPYNTMLKDDKAYPYIKVTVNEDFPRIFLTRERKNDGARYFGPYPRVVPIRRLLDWAWKKKLFPLRPCDLEFSEGHLPNPQKVQSCLYLHTGECPAPCVGKITKEEYRRMTDRVVLFLEGRHDRLQKDWEREMKAAARELNFEKAARLRDNVEAVRHMQERVTFRALRPEDVQSRIEMSRVLQDLQTVLRLPRPPIRIEAFDISHSQGAETVASLVTFERGKPLKSHYRKFIIRTVRGVDDFASMEEVVGRRYRRVKEDNGPWPDLVLIDGGPGQLSAALKALVRLGLRRLPIAALAKREEEVYLPEQSEPVRLSLESPVLHLLQRVRDESHRFAVTFHRARREKSFFEKGD
ncbi:MAG: excinuclease ABC subunit UvrC [Elusimicrobia bacterium]|nr:excinuclease ABC subunit UvrC [Elusimicrobiota bacterium]